MIIPATIRSRPVRLDVDDIHSITASKNEVQFHTSFGALRPLISLQDYASYFALHGFEMLNKSTLVQMSKIKHYDPELYVVTFDSELPSQGCFVSRRNRYKVRKVGE